MAATITQEDHQNCFEKSTPQMMADSEILALAKLPEIVTVYRGADFQRYVVGLSWSLDQLIARNFATSLHRYVARESVLIMAKVQRNKIIAYKLERKEAEVITKDLDYVAFEDLQLVG